MSTFVTKCERCKVDGVNIVLDTLREVRGLAGFWLVKATTPAGHKATVAWVGSSEAAKQIAADIARNARENPGADLIINRKGEITLRRRSGKGGAA